MRKKLISLRTILLLVLVAGLLLSACGKKDSGQDRAMSNDEYEEKAEEKNQNEADLEEDLSEIKPEIHSDDGYYIDKLIEEAGVDRDSILSVSTAAYEGKDMYSSFLFVGKRDEDMGIYTGAVWFVNGDKAEKILESENGYYSVGNVLEFPDAKKCFFYIEEYYVTQAVSYVYGVEDNESYETPVSRVGALAYNIENTFTITVGAYDNTYYSEDDMMLGHTWKPYYFYYDIKKDCFKEFVGKPVSTLKIAEMYGHDVVKDIKDINGIITNAFVRDNGILTVNYYICNNYDGGYSIDYEQANFNINTGKYIDSCGDGNNNITSSSFGGTYVAAILPNLMYDKNMSEEEIYDFFVNGKLLDKECEYFTYFLPEGEEDDTIATLECRMLDVDKNGVKELIPELYGSYTYCMYTIKDGYISKIDMSDCIFGSEGGFFNDKNQYVGHDCSHANRNQYLISEYDSEDGMKIVLFFAKWWEDDSEPDNAEYVMYDGGDYWDASWDDFKSITAEEYQKLVDEYTVKNTEIK